MPFMGRFQDDPDAVRREQAERERVAGLQWQDERWARFCEQQVRIRQERAEFLAEHARRAEAYRKAHPPPPRLERIIIPAEAYERVALGQSSLWEEKLQLLLDHPQVREFGLSREACERIARGRSRAEDELRAAQEKR